MGKKATETVKELGFLPEVSTFRILSSYSQTLLQFEIRCGLWDWHTETISDGGHCPPELTPLCYTVFRNTLKGNKFIHVSTVSQD